MWLWMISVGRSSVCAKVRRPAVSCSIWLASVTCSTCQPQAVKRAATSSVKVIEVAPSMLMRLLS